MKKKWLILLFTVMFMFGSITVFSSCEFAPFDLNAKSMIEDTLKKDLSYLKTDLAYERITGKDEICITGIGMETSKHIVIPKKVKGMPVVDIKPNCFKSSAVEKVTILAQLTSIPTEAFSGMSCLTSIVIPDSITSIGNGAFSDCTSLTSITIPDGVTSIGDSAFASCTSLTSIIIPDSVTSIGGSAFSGCNNLTSVYITDIEAWWNISFADYYANPLYFAHNLYLNNELVTELKIPDGITSIVDSAFAYCRSLTNITIPDGVTSIGDSAFVSCSSLTSIEIPDSVTSIAGSAFFGCDSLMSVYITDIEAWCNISFADYYANPLYFAHNLYLNNELVTELKIPDGVTSISDSAFVSCSSLTSIEIPDSVTSISDSAFAYCRSLTSIEIPDSVTSIGGRAFRNCTSLTSVVISDSVISIGEGAFFLCGRLTDVYYGGTQAEWEKITISGGNEDLTNATIHFLGEEN